MLSVDYIGMIPLLVDALRDQKTQIDSQAKQIADLTDLINKSSSGSKKVSAAITETDALTYPILDQNIPNPFMLLLPLVSIYQPSLLMQVFMCTT